MNYDNAIAGKSRILDNTFPVIEINKLLECVFEIQT